MRAVSAAWVLLLGACGSAPGVEATAFMSVPIPQALTCPNPSALDGMSAFARIGGHLDCPLVVDSQTRVASGSCERITVGIVRPLMIVYEATQPAGAAQLAYHIGYVDLRKSSLQEGQTEVTVALATDDTTGALVVDDPRLPALLGAAPAGDFKDALDWAMVEVADNGDSLDREGDGCPNLVELCQLGYTAFFAETTATPGGNTFDCN